ncbi:hypothetical protein GOODEAATRI_012377, partial [Goodea atripinnis]
DSKRARAKVSVVVVTDGRFDPRDDDSQLRYLCDDPTVVVNAIGVGDMFDKKHDSETLMVANALTMAKTRNDLNGARLALIEFGKENENQVAFLLTHELNGIASGLSGLSYLDSSSAVGPAIFKTINEILGKGSTRKTRRGAEVSFVFITDGITDTTNLDEAANAMRREQIVSTVISTGSDADEEVVIKLAMGDQNAIFKGQTFSDVLQPSLFNRFIRWVC